MSMLIPFSYILFGFIFGKIWKNSSHYLSSLLINIFIPIVVLMTILSYKGNIFHIVLLSYTFSLIMYKVADYIYTKHNNKPIMKLCFSYYNIGWLGLPISIYFFGEIATPIMIAAYIGGMIYGSTICIYSLNLLSNSNEVSPFKKLFTSMPFLSFLIAILIKFIFGTINIIEAYSQFYDIAKLCMSILGMGILGIWLEKSPLKKEYWKEAIIFSINRLIIGFIILAILLSLMYFNNFLSVEDINYLMIIPLLPVAANIVVLETYYLKSAKSIHIIMINTIFSLILLFILGLYL